MTPKRGTDKMPTTTPTDRQLLHERINRDAEAVRQARDSNATDAEIDSMLQAREAKAALTRLTGARPLSEYRDALIALELESLDFNRSEDWKLWRDRMSATYLAVVR